MKKTASAVTILAALLLASCTRVVEPDAEFVENTDIQLVVKGSKVCVYNPSDWQLGYNEARKEFRMSDDRMKNWCTVTCAAIPKTVGQKFNATVQWSTSAKDGSEKGTFEVVKVQDSKYWLWCGAKNRKIAVTVCVLD
jgi:hypothetical protein